jgi:hypothetical protein
VNLWHLARHEDDAGELRVRQQRRPQVPVSQSRRGRFEEVSEKVGLTSRRWALAAVAADLRDTGYPDLFIANDYGVSELFINEAASSARWARRRRRLRAEERHERLRRRRAEPGHVRRLRLEHLRGRHPDPGQQPVGADRRHAAAADLRERGRGDGRRSGGWSFGAQFGD